MAVSLQRLQPLSININNMNISPQLLQPLSIDTKISNMEVPPQLLQPLSIDTNIMYALDMSKFPGLDDPWAMFQPALVISTLDTRQSWLSGEASIQREEILQEYAKPTDTEDLYSLIESCQLEMSNMIDTDTGNTHHQNFLDDILDFNVEDEDMFGGISNQDYLYTAASEGSRCQCKLSEKQSEVADDMESVEENPETFADDTEPVEENLAMVANDTESDKENRVTIADDTGSAEGDLVEVEDDNAERSKTKHGGHRPVWDEENRLGYLRIGYLTERSPPQQTRTICRES